MSNQLELLSEVFDRAHLENRAISVHLLPIGYPYKESTVPLIKTIADNGADIIKLTIPFSDSAEGPVVAEAGEVGMANGVTSLKQCLDYVREAREMGISIPILLTSAYNLLAQYNSDDLVTVRACAEAGVSGFVLPDLPVHEAGSFLSACKQMHLAYVPLLFSSSAEARVKYVVQHTESFIIAAPMPASLSPDYSASDLAAAVAPLVENIKKYSSKPIVISTETTSHCSYVDLVKNNPSVSGFLTSSSVVSVINKVSTKNTKHLDLVNHHLAVSDYVGQTLTDSLRGSLKPIEGEVSNIIESGVEESRVEEKSSVDGADEGTEVNGGEVNGSEVSKADGSEGEDYSGAMMTLPSHYGMFGGAYVPEALFDALLELESQFNTCLQDPEFHTELSSYYAYLSRPSSIHKAPRLTEKCRGATIWLKREDLNHTGSHKINNALGQALMAKRLGKTRVIAETGAGQHGVATATVCALLELECVIYMGEEDIKRQELNVFRMKLLGATVVCVTEGSRTLKEAVNAAMKEWVCTIHTTHYLVGSAIGPHPFPSIVKHFQKVISEETKAFFLSEMNCLPDAIVACIGGGSNAIGSFAAFIDDPEVRLIGCEANGDGGDNHSSTLERGSIGVFHGCKMFLLQDEDGQILPTHSISPGLNYAGVGPEHSHLKYSKRAEYVSVSDKQALEGCIALSRCEGIIPALESSHAVYHGIELAKTMPKNSNLVITVSGRGDKDVDTILQVLPSYFPDLIQ